MAEQVSIEVMQSVVQAFIKAKKGVDVIINIEAHAKERHPVFQLPYLQDQLIKLNRAYSVAKAHFA